MLIEGGSHDVSTKIVVALVRRLREQPLVALSSRWLTTFFPSESVWSLSPK